MRRVERRDPRIGRSERQGAVGMTAEAQADGRRLLQESLRSAEVRVLEMVSAGEPLHDILEAVAAAIQQVSPETMASILLLDRDGVHVRHGAAPSLPPAFTAAVDGKPIGPLAGSCGTALYRRAQVIVEDIETDPLWADYREHARAGGLRACWSTPVLDAAGPPLGSFAMYYREPRRPTAADLELIDRVVHLVRIAMMRARKDEELKASEARFYAVARATANVVWDWDLASGTVWRSDDLRVAKREGPTDLVPSVEAWETRIHPDDRERVVRGVRAAIARRDPFWRDEYRLLRDDGTVVEVEDRGSLVFDGNGVPARFVGGTADVTEQRRSERALRERVKELRCLYRVLELTTDDGRSVEAICADVAAVLPESLQFEAEAVARIVVRGGERTSPGWQAPAVALQSPLRDGREQVGFIEVGYPAPAPGMDAGAGAAAGAGEPFLAEERALLDAVAAHVGRMLAARRLSERLGQAERLRAVGQLTGGIAHDFNNLLMVVGGNSEALVERLAGDPEGQALAEVILATAERGADMTRRLLAFARRQALDPKVSDLRRLLAGMDALLRRSLGEQVEIRTIAAEDVWPALVDPPQLENAILNLCINARDAMPGGGRLTVELGNARLDRDFVGSDDIVPGEYVLIAVSDTGTGMPPEVLAQAFEPFFTTKAPGRGTGLGLSTVFGFVKQSGGHIRIYSEPGQGTSVKIYLPRAELPAAEAVPRVAAPVAAGSERILLVEDDDLVRRHVTLQLEGLGYGVVAAADGAAALRRIEAGEPFDLLFTDVMMPGMNGRELAEAARALRPGLPVLFTSGYTEEALGQQGTLEEGVHILNKPYRRGVLAAKLREVLDAEARAPGGARR